MKKNIYILYIVTISLFMFPLNLVSQNQHKIDSIHKLDWDNSLEWQLTIRDIYSYTNGGNDYSNLHRLKKDSITSNWENSLQQIRVFNSENNLDTEIFQIWDEGQWKDNSKSTYSYDSYQNNDTIVHYSYKDNNWCLKRRQVMTYNSNNLIVETIIQDWNLNTIEFDNKSRNINFYENNLISESMYQIWNNDEAIYENVNKSVNTYEGIINLIKQQDSYTWNKDIGEWNISPNSCSIFTYINSLIKTFKIQVADSTGLKNQSLNTYTYVNENPVEIIQQIWKDSGDGIFNWVNSSLQTYTYDINNQVISQISSIWSPSSTWEYYQKSIYFTSGFLGIISENLDRCKVYPNPFNNDLNILLKTALDGDGILQIFDVNGKEISKIELRAGVKSIKLNNSYLSKGLYFIKISSGSQTTIFKVVKR
jgi:hypothetical protein